MSPSVCRKKKTNISPWTVQHSASLGFVYHVVKTWGSKLHQYNVTVRGSGTRLHISKF